MKENEKDKSVKKITTDSVILSENEVKILENLMAKSISQVPNDVNPIQDDTSEGPIQDYAMEQRDDTINYNKPIETILYNANKSTEPYNVIVTIKQEVARQNHRVNHCITANAI